MSYKHTKRWSVDNNDPLLKVHPVITEAGVWISDGEVVAFPTETVYGLGGNACSDKAIERIFAAKGRPVDNPLIVHISTVSQLEELSENVPDLAKKLAGAFWPGPLTLIVPKKDNLSEKVSAGLSTIAVRMPDHPVALALIEAAGVPIAAPSANQSGKPSPTRAEHVMHDLNGKIAGVIDSGTSGYGLESTVVDCSSGDKVWILRPGGVTKEQLETIAGKGNVETAAVKKAETPKAPGMKYRHYAPEAPLVLIENGIAELKSLARQHQEKGDHVAVLTTDKHQYALNGSADTVISLGSCTDLITVASGLYESLRLADESGADVILCETFSRRGIGEAIMNRLEKAASGR
ncbi:L-threonylcarbamoyladenylate synthase [Alteribacillus sp. HJP-4]|uniref:L-threonylcarbamoyladenylate synthase n=1 Tax=Alteribacillus sp. HJP-4 TaxID=2775394 RepID=UPI0035CD2932